MSEQPANFDRCFPWQCNHCGKKEVTLATVENYEAEIRHVGRLHTFSVPCLSIPTCRACGEKVFTEAVDRQINEGLRTHLKLLTPDQIRAAMERIGLSQKEVANCLGIAEATLSRWMTETQIQSRSLDNLLRAYFAFPQVRSALCGNSQSLELGTSDIAMSGR